MIIFSHRVREYIREALANGKPDFWESESARAELGQKIRLTLYGELPESFQTAAIVAFRDRLMSHFRANWEHLRPAS